MNKYVCGTKTILWCDYYTCNYSNDVTHKNLLVQRTNNRFENSKHAANTHNFEGLFQI
jgi:hypothetical protein